MQSQLQKAVLLVKPTQQNQLLNDLQMTGFHILHTRPVRLTKEQALDFYEINRADRPFSNLSLLKINITKNIANKQVLAVCVALAIGAAKTNIIDALEFFFQNTAKWNRLIYHVTENAADIENELRFFFPKLAERRLWRRRSHETIRKILDKHVFSVLVQSLVNVVERCCREGDEVDLDVLADELIRCDSKRPIVTFPDDDN